MMRTIDLFFSFLIWHSSPQIFANSSAISPSFWDALDDFYILCVYFIQASDYSNACFVIFKHWQNCFYPFTPVCTSSEFDQAPPGSSSWQRSPTSSYHTIPFIFRVNTLKLRNFCQFPPSFDFQPVSLCFYLFFCHCFSCVGFLVGRKNLSTLTLTVVLRLMIPPCQLLSRFFTNSM